MVSVGVDILLFSLQKAHTMKTVMITGCSSGFGLETASHFLERGWNVVATMRSPQARLLPLSKRLRIVQLDVTDSASIDNAVRAAGPIDVLVNNAGVGMFGPIEGTPLDEVRAMFETNVFGMMAVTQAVLPQFRTRRAGVVVNLASTVTLTTMPLLAAYAASKHAVIGFSASLALEVQDLGIQVGVVVPGMAPETPFIGKGHTGRAFPAEYAPFVDGVLSRFTGYDGPVTRARDVAVAVWDAAQSGNTGFRVAAGADAQALFARG